LRAKSDKSTFDWSALAVVEDCDAAAQNNIFALFSWQQHLFQDGLRQLQSETGKQGEGTNCTEVNRVTK
jgi:hypothetical protein